MADKKLLASVALSAGLLAGGAAGVVLGVPGVSGAQTTTVPDQPTTTVPEDGQTTPDRPPRGDRENCPAKDGTGDQAPAPSSSSNAAFRRGPGGRV